MDIIKAVVLGIIQGLAEFFPISSSGHLVLAHELLGLSFNEAENLTFDVFLHLGTLIAVCIVFRKTVWGLILAFFSSIKKIFTGKYSWKTAEKYEKMLGLLVLSCLPLFVVLFVKDYIEAAFSSALLVGIMLLITAAILFISDKLQNGKYTARTAKPWHPLVIGAIEAVAVIPGISRSGSTIFGGLVCGFDRKFATEFAFIMSIPAVLAATLLEVKDIIEVGMDTDIIYCLVGVIVSAVVGIFAIKLVQFLANKKQFKFFSVYCLIVGVTVIIWSLLV